MTILFPSSLVPDFISNISLGSFNTEITEFKGKEERRKIQNYPSELRFTMQYINKPQAWLEEAIKFNSEVRGGRSFILPKEVWRHGGVIYDFLVNRYKYNQFIFEDTINIETVRENIYNFSLNLISVLKEGSSLIVQSFSETWKVIARLPDSQGYYVLTPEIYTFTNNNPNFVYFVKGEESGTNKIVYVKVADRSLNYQEVNTLYTFTASSAFPVVDLVKIG
jgi:hypothetical protein